MMPIFHRRVKTKSFFSVFVYTWMETSTRISFLDQMIWEITRTFHLYHYSPFITVL